MKNKRSFFLFEVLAVIINAIISITLCLIFIMYNYESPWSYLYLFEIILMFFFIFLILFSLYNIFRIIKLNNKLLFFKKCIFCIIQFLSIQIIIALLLSTFIWCIHGKLLSITKYSFFRVYRDMIFFTFIICFIIASLLNIKKLIKINIFIYFRLIPLKLLLLYIICFFMYVYYFGITTVYYIDPSKNIRGSQTFNIYNINKIELGLEKEEIIELIGEPLYSDDYYNYLSWTDKSKYKWGLAWFGVIIAFEDNKAVRLEIGWRDY